MNVRAFRALIVAALCLVALAACSTTSDVENAGRGTAGPPGRDATGTVPTRSAKAAMTLADDPDDDVRLGKKYFRGGKFGLAEASFHAAIEKHPGDAAAWIGLAVTYDRRSRFDLADRAYREAIRIAGPTVEILNDQGFSYMLRGDHARAREKLDAARAKDPANPEVRANLRLLEDAKREKRASR